MSSAKRSIERDFVVLTRPCKDTLRRKMCSLFKYNTTFAGYWNLILTEELSPTYLDRNNHLPSFFCPHKKNRNKLVDFLNFLNTQTVLL